LFTVQVSSLLVGVLTNNLITTIALYSTGTTLCVTGFLVMIIFMSGNGWATLLVPILQSLAWSLLLSTPLIIAQTLNLPPLPWLLLLLLTGVLMGGRYLYLYRTSFFPSTPLK
ncbi:MAG: lipopolysaccharide biosynthesis protein, partial [Myxococcota bacterium]|nr:lipopolysaccharide biosynthesis protein [Myxococcota bacterium]